MSRSKILNVRNAAAALIWVMSTAPAAGQDADPAARKWTSEVGLQGLMYDNFFQAPSGLPEENIQAFNGEVEGAVRPRAERPLELFGTIGATTYSDSLGDSPSLGAGVRWDGRPVRAEASAEYEADRPTVDVGDALGVADTTRFRAEYGYRFTDSWEATLRGLHQDQRFERVEGRDNDFTSAGVALRYRGWGYGFSPEVGFDTGSRSATDTNEDLDQQDYWIQLRSIPSDGLYLSLRYRYRARDYTIGDPLSSNFNREDDRQQIALTVDYELTDPWSIGAYYAYQDADSTNPNRIFTTQLVVIGTKLRF